MGEEADIDMDKYKANRIAFAETLKLLKERTGRDKFTLEELMNPSDTIIKYTKTKGK